jgi:hypothetical protein
MRTFAYIALVIAAFALSQSRAADPTTTPPPNTTPPTATDTQPGVGERVGESVDRGLSRLGEKLRRGWAEIRRSVDELGVQGRVYGRIRWDKQLANAAIEISVQNENIVTLTGTVPDDSARHNAVALAENTVGVGKVIDHLAVAGSPAPPSVTLPPAGANTPKE